LRAVEHSGNVDARPPEELSDAELISLIAGGRTGTAGDPKSH